MENIGTLRAELMLEAKQFKQKMNETKEEIKGLSKSADEESKKMNKSFTAINQSLENMGLNSNQISKINDQIKKVRPKDLEKELALVRKELTAMGLSASEIDKITKEMIKAEQASRGLVIGMNHIQTASLAVVTAVGAVYGASIPLAATFEQKMADIKAISETTGDEMERLTQLAQEMGEKTAFSATEAAAGIEELIKAGVSVETIINGGLESALNLAVAGGLQLAEAAEIASTSLNAFRDDNLKASDSANILAGAANASATDVREMQYGLSQVSAVASGAGMSFQDTATALATFAQNGLKGSDAGTSLKTMLSNLQPTTKDQIRLFKELGLMTANGQNAFYDLNGELKGIDEIAGLLQTSMKDLTDQQRSLALETIFGSDAVRAGNILYKEGEQGIRNMWKAMSQVTAAEVAATKVDTLNGAFNEFTSVLETAGIQIGEDFLPLLTDIVRYGTDVMRSLNDMNGANLKAGLAFAGTAAAVALVISTISKLAVAVRTLYVSMGPAGWLITGVSLLAGAIAGVVTKNKELDESMLNSLKSRVDEQKSLDDRIKRYEELENRSRLTNKELGRFVDINSEIQKTADPQVIEDLRKEQDQLREKSGLSNDELEEMLGLNQRLIEKVPEATAKITDQGNRILDNVDALKKYSDAQLEKLYADLDIERIKNETKYKDLLEDEQELIKNSKTLEEDLVGLKGEKYTAQQKLTEEQETLNSMMADTNKWSQIEIDNQKTKVNFAQQELDKIQKKLETKAEDIQKNQEDLGITRDKIAKLEDVRYQMAQIVLAQNGLNAKKGEELTTIDQQLSKLESARQKLVENTSAADKNRAEYKEALAEIDKQIGALQSVKNKVLEITATAKDMNYELGREIQKRIITNQIEYLTQVRQKPLPTGPQDQRHQGGPARLRDLPQLHVGGLVSTLKSSPMHNEVDLRLLKNETVLTEAQQANLFRIIDAGFTNKPSSQQSDGKSVNYDIDIHAQNVDIDEDQLIRTLQRLEVLYE